MQAQAPSLVGLTEAEISALFSDRPDAKWRAKQVTNWIYKKAVAEYGAMRDLPKDLRIGLGATHLVQPLEVVRHVTSTDGVDKLLVQAQKFLAPLALDPETEDKQSQAIDGSAPRSFDEAFECVLLPYPDRVSCCLSSQVGCPMACTFCATGLGGFDRNLTPGEIVGQYLMLQRLSERRISHVVFMGMGEPLLNYRNLLASLHLLHDEIGISYRHITVSTVGIVPQILELSREKLPIHLALSLHSPIDEIRERLMPVNKKWSVRETVDAMKQYQRSTNRKITIEYLLIDNLTDTPQQAAELARIIKGVPSVVNLIPFNYVQTEQGFGRPTSERVRAFRQELHVRGVNVTQRVERGHDIAAACGQLAGQHKGRFARRVNTSGLPVLSS